MAEMARGQMARGKTNFLAAEYPEGLCKTWAEEVRMHGTEYGDESAESPQKRSRGAPMFNHITTFL
jgi:hypothetical protein